jgi:hypothetical protein
VLRLGEQLSHAKNECRGRALATPSPSGIIVARVNAGIAREKVSGTRSGKPIGHAKSVDFDREAIRAALLRVRSVHEVVRRVARFVVRRQISA